MACNTRHATLNAILCCRLCHLLSMCRMTSCRRSKPYRYKIIRIFLDLLLKIEVQEKKDSKNAERNATFSGRIRDRGNEIKNISPLFTRGVSSMSTQGFSLVMCDWNQTKKNWSVAIFGTKSDRPKIKIFSSATPPKDRVSKPPILL